tara:strand:- start:927 stop:1286 length:360 start_codon:yes stop_codon:yes gene_type:complete
MANGNGKKKLLKRNERYISVNSIGKKNKVVKNVKTKDTTNGKKKVKLKIKGPKVTLTNKKGDTINVKKEAKKLKDKLKKLKLRDIIQGKKGKNKQRNRKNTRIRKRNAQGSSNPYNRVG